MDGKAKIIMNYENTNYIIAIIKMNESVVPRTVQQQQRTLQQQSSRAPARPNNWVPRGTMSQPQRLNGNTGYQQDGREDDMNERANIIQQFEEWRANMADDRGEGNDRQYTDEARNTEEKGQDTSLPEDKDWQY